MLSYNALRRNAEPGKEVAIRQFQRETAELQNSPEPARLRKTLHLAVALFISLLVVTLVMRLDRVVSTVAGSVVTTEPTTVLQALDPSIIRSLDVQEGDRVTAGQLLATLDPTFARADVAALTDQISSLDAQIARAEAELAQKAYAPSPGATGVAAQYNALQDAYFQERKGQFDAQVRSYDEQIAQTKATIAKLKNDLARYTDRANISKQIENMRAMLAASQVGSRLNLLVATDQRIEIMRSLELDQNGIDEAQHQLQAAIANRDAFVQQWFAQVSQELLKARNDRDNAKAQLAKAAKHQDLVRMEAPQDSVVLKLAKLSVGSVLKEGDMLVNLAPLRSPMEAEVHILARDIGFVRAGDRATIKLDAFNFVEHGTASGRVRWISEGAFTEDQNGTAVDPYYKARITLDDAALKNVPSGFRLVPGMTLSADIHVGTRSVFTYMLRGIIRGLNEAMREP